ncbi:hypothetical protein [Nonomuraea sp. NPDC049309]|uniref:hypothetical protein n=1 Tax=Nonomuraea sp. NPDC049309 TaxID=3364350 RepID=UPI003711F321
MGMPDYRWFPKAPHGRRAAEDGLIEYAMRIGGRAEHGQQTDYRETAERLLVAALLEDLRQAYRRRLFP